MASVREDNLKKYEAAIELHPHIQRKGKANPYTSHNGHMFSFLDKEGVLGIRLDEVRKQTFEEKYDSPPFIQHNSVMKGYVTIPQEVLDDTQLLLSYLTAGLEYVSSLKPKPTKKKK
ncbi:MAG: hypothetical protein ACPGTP_03485 [Bacteroidia bacterium]